MGNSGQGYLWRGRGFLQCTGKNNYSQFAADMNLPEVLENPDLVANEYAFETALWFFEANKLFEIADGGVTYEIIKKITKRVNGGQHGLKDRVKQTTAIFDYLS